MAASGLAVAVADEPRMGGTAHLQVAEIQRSRLLAAAVSVVDELGYDVVTVTHITQRAHVSRRTFYELFENREDCLAAMFEYTLAPIRAEILAAKLDGLLWRERTRLALWTILCFLDREPVLARVCVVQSLRGDQQVLERRTEVLAELARFVDEGRDESARGNSLAPLTAEGLVGAAHSIVYTRLLRSEPEPLRALLGDLMGMLVLPYAGPEAARREQARALPELPATGRVKAEDAGESAGPESDPLRDIPMRVTYRTACVLQGIAEQPGISTAKWPTGRVSQIRVRCPSCSRAWSGLALLPTRARDMSRERRTPGCSHRPGQRWRAASWRLRDQT